MDRFINDMRLAKQSEVTITKRVEIVERFRRFLDGVPLLSATRDQLKAFQLTFISLAPASIDIYTRHLKAFYAWALIERLITDDPARDLITPRLAKGRPHPIAHEDLVTVLHCAPSGLRMAFILAAFAGLRCGEICVLRMGDLDLQANNPTALIHGKGGKERVVPLIPAVVWEIRGYHPSRSGLLLTRDNGRPVSPNLLSARSSMFFSEIGIESTLHSLRHYYATTVGQQTHDAFFVRDLLGHESVATTEIYVMTSMRGAHERLAELNRQADNILSGTRSHLKALETA